MTDVPFFKPSLSAAETARVCDVLRSGWLTTGAETLAFERQFSAFMQTPPEQKNGAPKQEAVISLAVNSNTSGLLLAYEACGICRGSALITTPYTFVSTATSAVHLGADVLFADIEKDSYNIDPDAVEQLLKADTAHRIKAIVPVHVAGNPCDMARLCTLAQTYRVRIIEDAAHAFPAYTPGGYAGTIGDVGVFSFYATKTITTGEGGMICTRDAALARRMACMRMHGMDRTTWDRYTSPRASWEYDIVAPGFKCNLPDVLAAIGCEQLKKAPTLLAKRKAIAEHYTRAFQPLDFLTVPPDSPGNAWHLYLLRIVPEKLTITRNAFAAELQKSGIGVSLHFIPLFHFTYWKTAVHNFDAVHFPHAERQSATTISIPLWPDMTEDMVSAVITAVTEIGARFHV
ncbi:MAG: DegT/DnrJ/EryC1/StrS family aminotransferase [Treponema sp.]|nr:DegT/DnrJ/EryC1/StrS family aminotransferase [Treponema sp.]